MAEQGRAPRHRWQPAEDHVLKEQFEALGNYGRAFELLSHITRRQIQMRAAKLGLTKFKGFELVQVDYSDQMADVAYIVGLTEGKGYFLHHHLVQRGTFLTQFDFTVRRDEREQVYWLREFLGCGIVYDIENKVATGGAHQVRLLIAQIEDLWKRVVPVFETYQLKSKKREDFELWREAVKIRFEDFKKRPQPRHDQLASLAQALMANRPYIGLSDQDFIIEQGTPEDTDG